MGCCNPLAGLDPEFSGFPARVSNGAKSGYTLEFIIGDLKKVVHGLIYLLKE